MSTPLRDHLRNVPLLILVVIIAIVFGVFSEKIYQVSSAVATTALKGSDIEIKSPKEIVTKALVKDKFSEKIPMVQPDGSIREDVDRYFFIINLCGYEVATEVKETVYAMREVGQEVVVKYVPEALCPLDRCIKQVEIPTNERYKYPENCILPE